MAQKVEFILDLKTGELKSSSKQAAQHVQGIDKSVRGATQQTDKMAQSWKKFQRLIVGAAVFEIMRRGLRQMITLGKEFEQGLADLEAITGITGSSLQQLGDDATATSNRFGVAASRVIEAQKLVASQLAEKIDFGTEQGVRELSEIADAATLLSKAAGTELEPAVSTLTTAINQFNLPASESVRIVNAMAAGAKFGAAELLDQGEAIRDSGTSANAANVSFEQLNASIQTLAANGIRGAQAGVGLRNVFVRLETQSQKLAEAGYDVNLQQDGLVETLRKLGPLTEDVTTRTEVFGERAQAVAQILIQNVDGLEALEGKITDTDVAQQQASIQMNTFQGAVDKLSSAFNNQLIGAFTQTEGAMTSMIGKMTTLIEEFSGGLSIINGWIAGNQELRTELMTQEAHVEGLIKAYKENIQQAQAAIDAGGLEADQRKELTDFIAQQQAGLDDMHDTYSQNLQEMQARRDAMAQEIELTRKGIRAGTASQASLHRQNEALEILDLQIGSTSRRLETWTTIMNDATDATDQNTEADEENTEVKLNLAQQIEKNEEQIGTLLAQTTSLTDAQMDDVVSLMAQNRVLEEQIKYREELAQKQLQQRQNFGQTDDPEADPLPDLNIPTFDFEMELEPLYLARDVIGELNDRISHFVNMSDVLNQRQHDIGFAIQQTVGAIEQLINMGYDPASDAVQGLVDKYEKLMRAQQAQNTFMQVLVNSQISSLRELGNVIAEETRRAIKARIAEAVATQIGKVLAKVPFPFNVAAAAAAAGAVNLLFDKLIPEFREGGIVTGGGMRSGLTTSGQKLISINEDARPEFIVNADSTAAALPLLQAINEDANFARNLIGGFQAGGMVQGQAVDAGAIADAVVRGMRSAQLVARVEFTEFDDQYNDFKEFQQRIGNTD